MIALGGSRLLVVLALVAATAVLPAVGVGAQAPPPPALDLVALFPPAVPAGFQPLPDQPGRLGPLDAAAAATVLDQSGRVKAELLVKEGFRSGHAKAWSKQDAQEVIIDVLLEFDTERSSRTFHADFLKGRRQTTTPFALPGVPEASGFLRGPQTPTRTTPAQREVVLRRGRVMSIVVVAGFATYPALEPAVTMAEAQRAALAPAPETEGAGDVDVDDEDGAGRAGLSLLAMVLLVLVTGRLVASLREHPVVAARPLPW